jgi:hypothetical protein
MKILTTSTDNQFIKIISRSDAETPTLSITNKSTGVSSSVSVTKTTSGDYMVLTGSFSLKEGVMYSFKVKDGSNDIYRGLIFCTDQSNLDKYFINEGEYTEEDSYDNDYVII